MKNCPNCNEWVGDNVTTCFNCQYDFRLKMVPSVTERQNMAETIRKIKNRKSDVLRKNAEYEYQTEFIKDNADGTTDRDAINSCLKMYASQGWRLHSIFCNEIGKSTGAISIAGFGFGINATIEETIMVFERRIKEEE